MCGRYDLSENPAAIRAQFHVRSVPEFAPNHDVRPTDHAPIVRRNADGERECALARWGLVPSWAKEAKFGTRCFNARVETLATLPAFRNAYRHRRCLVPTSAFFEWSGPAGRRTKWRIQPDSDALLALAGLWESWSDPHSGQSMQTYTIVTTAANESLAAIHDRMPVIVRPERYDDWLDSNGRKMDLFVPVAEGGLKVLGA